MKAHYQETKGPANSTADPRGAKEAEIMREIIDAGFNSGRNL